MKYVKLYKLTRDEMVRLFRNDHPEYSYQEVGDVLGISKQRVEVLIHRGRRQELNAIVFPRAMDITVGKVIHKGLRDGR